MIFKIKKKMEVFQRHVNKSVKHYERQVLINLINQHGSESHLEKAFFEAYKQVNESTLKLKSFRIN